jgi:hypothetical protein
MSGWRFRHRRSKSGKLRQDRHLSPSVSHLLAEVWQFPLWVKFWFARPLDYLSRARTFVVKAKRYIGISIAALTAGYFLLVVALASPGGDSGLTRTMCGPWQGSAKIIVNWTQQTNLPVMVMISADGSVTGKVGDAVLEKGVFHRNRSSVGRRLNLATDYIITGQLTGPIIASEGVNRAGVKIPLNFRLDHTNQFFAGGLHTSGTKFGGKKKMILSASNLTLKRPGPLSP